MQELAKKFISPREYFEMEEVAEYKNVYYHGEIFAMSGASFYHNVIAGNTFAALHGSLSDSDCFVLLCDMKIQVDEERHYTYPDLSVVCGDVGFAENRNDVIRNPVVIIEILSKSTRDAERPFPVPTQSVGTRVRGTKFTAYRNIASLKDYVLIDQYTCHVEFFHKNESNQWSLSEFKDMNDMSELSVNIGLSLNTIYNRVKW